MLLVKGGSAANVRQIPSKNTDSTLNAKLHPLVLDANTPPSCQQTLQNPDSPFFCLFFLVVSGDAQHVAQRYQDGHNKPPESHPQGALT
eukprot:m.177880 g.177880  ORF g.177880 m.177880 type:complete len:89 (+) comp17973_c0_seq2:1073-1339(+)